MRARGTGDATGGGRKGTGGSRKGTGGSSDGKYQKAKCKMTVQKSRRIGRTGLWMASGNSLRGPDASLG